MIALILVGAGLLYLVLRYSVLYPEPRGIRILMYHDIHRENRDFLTVAADDFRQQLQWLKDQGYSSISMETAILHFEGRLTREDLPPRPILITFDDGYKNLLPLAVPLLREFGFQATLFAATGMIEGSEKREKKLMNSDDLTRWVGSGMDVALHSHAHFHYGQASLEKISEDLRTAESLLEAWKIPTLRALAYPFGGRPKDPQRKVELETQLQKIGLRAAFRIGNRIEPFFQSSTNRMDLRRIDIRGDEPFFEFRIKVRKGRARRF